MPTSEPLKLQWSQRIKSNLPRVPNFIPFSKYSCYEPTKPCQLPPNCSRTKRREKSWTRPQGDSRTNGPASHLGTRTVATEKLESVGRGGYRTSSRGANSKALNMIRDAELTVLLEQGKQPGQLVQRIYHKLPSKLAKTGIRLQNGGPASYFRNRPKLPKGSPVGVGATLNKRNSIK
jgi:hypothetical protein